VLLALGGLFPVVVAAGCAKPDQFVDEPDTGASRPAPASPPDAGANPAPVGPDAGPPPGPDAAPASPPDAPPAPDAAPAPPDAARLPDAALPDPAPAPPDAAPPRPMETVSVGVAEAAFQAEFDRQVGRGLQHVWQDDFDVGGTPFVNAIFRTGSGAVWRSRSGLTAAGFQTEVDGATAQGFRALQVESSLRDNAVRYAVIWEQSPGPEFRLYHGQSGDQHQRMFDELTAAGWTPINISAVSLAGTLSFTALYEKRDLGAFEAWALLSLAEFEAKQLSNTQAGRNLIYFNAYLDGNAPRLTAIWQQNAPAATVRVGLTAAQLRAEVDRNAAAGLLTRAVTGYGQQGQARFAAFWSR
jgi:hypothetical protein